MLMTGFDASSSDRYSGPVELQLYLTDGTDAEAVALVESRVNAFFNAIEAGFFFPGTLRNTAPKVLRCNTASVRGKVEVSDLAITAVAVLGGMLADCRHSGVSFRSAQAIFGSDRCDLLVEVGLRPAAVDDPPFSVELPDDLGGNYALLVEIEFAKPVSSETKEKLLDELALWETLSLAYPIDPDEPAEVGGAQRLFNDARTIHHHEWVWDNADPSAWNLLINLCCAWSRYLPVIRLHVE
jgi:hypothetical protein